MTALFCLRRWTVFAGAALVLLAAPPVTAQYAGESYGGSAGEGQRGYGSGENVYVPRGDKQPPPGGYNNPYQSQHYAPPGESHGAARETYSRESNPGRNEAYSARGSESYGGNESYSPRGGDAYGGNEAYSPRGGGSYGNESYSPPGSDAYGGNDAYSPRQRAYGGEPRNHSYSDQGQPYDGGGYGEPYAPPPAGAGDAPPYDVAAPQGQGGTYSENEIVSAGHGFFGAISQNLASAVEYAFKSQGRPNGYILGEDAGGAFVLGLRYGEGRLYTKDAGDHKVFWQGPSVGYDAGAEGSKTMVLVYNMRDPSEIYQRFGGVQGSVYVIGGLSVQFQKYGDVTLALIRSGVGLRLGANVGYLKYTRTPTWNPL
ncbi:hypothetical protein W911_15585 [Hyphomicrobium nitrativorans NL23]|uniref:DUF1134 domain-containing protein n=1 Tax=Hyphomicrobium nitrativorans NL23 TaxID=1029756 RepID=V5SHS7_9HYPH|nr:DUF1134 domain-containing protein [Hyphomicrobium nitrativorans]AHB49499.1 hypothetical protein W911_15585 [Hyphomicrobium nitrativorans NL23]